MPQQVRARVVVDRVVVDRAVLDQASLEFSELEVGVLDVDDLASMKADPATLMMRWRRKMIRLGVIAWAVVNQPDKQRAVELLSPAKKQSFPSRLNSL